MGTDSWPAERRPGGGLPPSVSSWSGLRCRCHGRKRPPLIFSHPVRRLLPDRGCRHDIIRAASVQGARLDSGHCLADGRFRHRPVRRSDTQRCIVRWTQRRPGRTVALDGNTCCREHRRGPSIRAGCRPTTLSIIRLSRTCCHSRKLLLGQRPRQVSGVCSSRARGTPRPAGCAIAIRNRAPPTRWLVSTSAREATPRCRGS